MHEWWSKVSQALRGRRGFDDDLSEEMRAHLDLITDENMERAKAGFATLPPFPWR